MTKINKASLVEQLQLHDLFADATKKQVTEFVEDFFELIADTVEQNGEFSIPKFGKFSRYTSTTTGKHKPKFTPSSVFKDRLNDVQ